MPFAPVGVRWRLPPSAFIILPPLRQFASPLSTRPGPSAVQAGRANGRQFLGPRPRRVEVSNQHILEAAGSAGATSTSSEQQNAGTAGGSPITHLASQTVPPL